MPRSVGRRLSKGRRNSRRGLAAGRSMDNRAGRGGLDLELIHDAEQMTLLTATPAWAVIVRYAGSLRDDALAKILNPTASDQDVHHWRGVLAGLARMVALPDEIRTYEKARRPQPS